MRILRRASGVHGEVSATVTEFPHQCTLALLSTASLFIGVEGKVVI